MEQKIDYAAEAVLLGGRVALLKGGTKRPLGPWQKDARKRNREEVCVYLKQGHNLAMVADDELVFIDVEGPAKGTAANGNVSLAALQGAYGNLPYAPRYRTPSGGEQIVFRVPPGGRVPFVDVSREHGLELRTGGHFSLLPPSFYDGKAEGKGYSGSYEWEVTPSQVIDSEGEIPVVPEWLVDFFCNAVGRSNEETVAVREQRATSPTGDVGAGYLRAIEDNIFRLSADCSYQEWWRVMAVCHRAGDEGKGLFARWSRETGGARWNDAVPALIDRLWAGLDRSREERMREGKPLLGLTSLMQAIRNREGSEEPIPDIKVTIPSPETLRSPVTSEQEADEKFARQWPLLPLTGCLETFRQAIEKSMPWQTEAQYAVPLVCLQMVLQRKLVYRHDGLQSHWWCFVGGPASNKSEMKRIIKEVITPIDSRLAMDAFESNNGLKSMLAEYPSRALIMDEGLKVFNSVLNAEGKSPLDAKTLALILNLHNNKTNLEATANRLKSHRVPKITLPQLAVVTFDQNAYWAKFRTGSAIDCGLLSRFFVINLNAMPKLACEKEKERIPASAIKAFSSSLRELIPYMEPQVRTDTEGDPEFHSWSPVDFNDPSNFYYGEGTLEVFHEFNDSMITWTEADEETRTPVMHRLAEGQRLLAQLLARAERSNIVTPHHARVAAGIAFRTALAVGKQTTTTEVGIIRAATEVLQAQGPMAISNLVKKLPFKFRSSEGDYSRACRLIKDFFAIKENRVYLPF